MGSELINLSFGALAAKQAAEELLCCNRISEPFGLSLTPQQAAALTQTRQEVLQSTGRIELGGGIFQKLITAFCDSPYITQYDYEQTLHELLELFYWCKNETLDKVSDDVLIGFMKRIFDGPARGSMELLQDYLEQMAKGLRRGSTGLEEE